MSNRAQALAKKYLTAETTRQAGYGVAPKVYAMVDAHTLVLWTSFASFGRAHHLISQLNWWDSALYKVGRAARLILEDNSIPSKFGREVFFEPDKHQPREMQAYVRLRPQTGSWDRDQIDLIKSVVHHPSVADGLRDMF